MSEHEISDEDAAAEVGECGLCHQMTEIVATIAASGIRRGTDEVVIPGEEIDACESCVRTVVEEMKGTATSVTIGLDDSPTSED